MWQRIKRWFKNLFAKKQLPAKKSEIVAPSPEPEKPPKGAPKKGFGITLEMSTVKLRRGRVSLPAVGRFVEESHYATKEDSFGDRLFPKTSTEDIFTHLRRSYGLIKNMGLDVNFDTLYKQSWQKRWTPPEGGKAGQAARGNLKPSAFEEMWQGNMLWARGHMPKVGTKFMVEANGRRCVIQMGYEHGPASDKYLGGVTREVHWWLGTNNSSQIKLYKVNDDAPLGPVLQAEDIGEKPDAVKQREEMQKDPIWLKIAEAEKGVKEYIPGSNSRIEEYHDTTEARNSKDDVAWCSSFVNWVFKQAGIKGTNSSWSRSWLNWGVGLAIPRRGCLAVFVRNNSSWQGHVGFYMDEDSEHIYLLGGNQSNAVNIKAYKKKDLLGYRWPSEQ